MELFSNIVAEVSCNPEWCLLLMLLIPVAAGISCWREHRADLRREAMPHTMTDDQYARFNHGRFDGK
jgi:hypothetical protein